MSATGGADERDMTYAERLWPPKGVAATTEAELREALWALSAHAPPEVRRAAVPLLNGAITDLVALREQLAPVADDYPAAVFRDLWRVLGELRAATGEEGRA